MQVRFDKIDFSDLDCSEHRRFYINLPYKIYTKSGKHGWAMGMYVDFNKTYYSFTLLVKNKRRKKQDNDKG